MYYRDFLIQIKKMKKKILLIAFLLLTSAIIVNAQNVTNDYKTAIGFKSLPGGISYKHFISNNNAVEGIMYFDRDVTRFTALYEIHYDIQSTIEGLKWFIGPGVHLGGWTPTFKANNPKKSGLSTMGVGLDGIIGIDYKIDALPFDISVDWQPSFNLTSYSYLSSGITWGGVAFRYTIK